MQCDPTPTQPLSTEQSIRGLLLLLLPSPSRPLQGGLVVDEWRRLERAVQEEWRGALQTAAKGAEAPAPAPGPAKGEAMEQADGVVPPYLEFDPTGQRPPRPLRKPPQALQTVRPSL